MNVQLDFNQQSAKIQAEVATKSPAFDGDVLREITRIFILWMHESQKQHRSYAFWEKQETRKLNKNVRALYNDKTQLALGITAGILGIVGGVFGCASINFAPLSNLSQGLSAGSQGLQALNTTIQAPKEGEKAYQQMELQLQQRRLDEAKQNAQSDKQKEDQLLSQLKQAEDQEHNAKTSIAQGR